MNQTSIHDIITLVANHQHGEATGILNEVLTVKIGDALEAHKQTIARSLFAPSADALTEDVEQLDEISRATAYSVGEKRQQQSTKLRGAAERSEDPFVKKVFANQADAKLAKAKKAFKYVKSKSTK
jgi:hypothetical protein